MLAYFNGIINAQMTLCVESFRFEFYFTNDLFIVALMFESHLTDRETYGQHINT